MASPDKPIGPPPPIIGLPAGVTGIAPAGNGTVGVFANNNNDHTLAFLAGTNTSINAPTGQGTVGVCGEAVGSVAGAVGILGSGIRPALAAKFIGDVEVTGDISLVNQDLAEDFEIQDLEDIEPGLVMVFNAEGKLRPCRLSYDTKVAGVIAGAGEFKPGIVLGKLAGSRRRLPIALVGRVYCRADATSAAIEVGDLLTTSSTLGHAMKADNARKAFGAVIGKALKPLPSGRGLIPILVPLQ